MNIKYLLAVFLLVLFLDLVSSKGGGRSKGGGSKSKGSGNSRPKVTGGSAGGYTNRGHGLSTGAKVGLGIAGGAVVGGLAVAAMGSGSNRYYYNRRDSYIYGDREVQSSQSNWLYPKEGHYKAVNFTTFKDLNYTETHERCHMINKVMVTKSNALADELLSNSIYDPQETFWYLSETDVSRQRDNERKWEEVRVKCSSIYLDMDTKEKCRRVEDELRQTDCSAFKYVPSSQGNRNRSYELVMRKCSERLSGICMGAMPLGGQYSPYGKQMEPEDNSNTIFYVIITVLVMFILGIGAFFAVSLMRSRK